MSNAEDYITATGWYTADELKKNRYSFIGSDTLEPTVEIDGKKYKKADVEKAIKDLEPIE